MYITLQFFGDFLSLLFFSVHLQDLINYTQKLEFGEILQLYLAIIIKLKEKRKIDNLLHTLKTSLSTTKLVVTKCYTYIFFQNNNFTGLKKNIFVIASPLVNRLVRQLHLKRFVPNIHNKSVHINNCNQAHHTISKETKVKFIDKICHYKAYNRHPQF